ncbi:MAG TPA: DUF481 domain-containing protein [Thermoguttaceae bacterium]|nr:DUF481 domain-containing protein [Thermoguttaceae bacterium]
MRKCLFVGLWAACAAGAVLYAQEPAALLRQMPEASVVRRLPPLEPVFPHGETIPPGVPSPQENLPPADSTGTEPNDPLAEILPPEELIAPPVVKIWEGSVELGLDGAEGNTQAFNLKFGVDAKRKTDRNVFTLDLDYRKKTDRARETANRAFLDWRYEWLLQDSPWTCFTHGTVDYDEFQAFDVRVTTDIGLGYQFIETDRTTFAGRVGSGFSREIGGPDDNYVPEAVFGLDYERKLTNRQKLTMKIDYMPDVTEFNDFRLHTRAGWEMLIDRQMNLSLKLSVLDRYDGTPNGAKPNDLDYTAVLLWKF